MANKTAIAALLFMLFFPLKTLNIAPIGQLSWWWLGAPLLLGVALTVLLPLTVAILFILMTFLAGIACILLDLRKQS